MIWPLSPAVVLLLAATLVSASIAWVAWQRRATPAAWQLALIMLALMVWTLAYALEMASPSLRAKLVWTGVEYLGIAFVPPLWLLFVLAYTRNPRWSTGWRLLLWLVIPTLTVALNWTNTLHHGYYRQVSLNLDGPFPELVTAPGPWFWVHTAYSYLALVCGAGLLWGTVRHAPLLYRRQVGVLLAGVSMPGLASLIYVSGLNPLAPLDITPFAFVLTGIVLAWGLFRHHLGTLVPMARDRVLDQMSDAVVMLDAEQRIVDLNLAAQRLFALAPAIAVGQSATTGLAAWPALVQACQAPSEVHLQLTWEQPALRVLEVHVSPLADQAGRISGRLLIWHDITTLRREHAYLAALHQLTLDWLTCRALDDLLQAIVESAAALLDAPCSELMLKEGELLVVRAFTSNQTFLQSDRVSRDEARVSWQAHDTGQPVVLEDYAVWPYRRACYANFPLHAIANLPIMAGPVCLGVLGLGRIQPGHRFTPDELQRGMLFAQLAALMLDNASLYAAAQREIAERKQAEAERERLQAQMLQAQKMEAIGQVAGGIAHDFNNILTVISGNTDLALAALAVDHPVYRDLQAIQHSATHAAQLIRQILTFARRQVSQPELVDLNALVQRLSPMLRPLVGTQIELVCQPAPHLDRVTVDPHQIEQVLINLVINARDAMPHGGTLTLATANAAVTAADTCHNPDVPPGPYVALLVSDTGVGMTEGVQAHLFEPYYTTKAVGHGTGLGLATCLGIVKQHRGCIRVESAPGQGSRFWVYLPSATDEPLPLSALNHASS
ncbi:MAG: histidine kinase N-terminal 7TM domain-containing protein [Chloroflexales bacterium]